MRRQWRPSPELMVRLLSGMVRWLRGRMSIVQLVLRGYLTGQPISEERPRKGCC
ncbi:MAG: hypothetical protein ACOYLF_09550 [Blastocatellia bacterium]